MATNTITINFEPCDPAPANGYLVKYKPIGGGDYRTHPTRFMSSPAVIVSTVDPANTSYEGTIQGDCGNGTTGVPVRWLALNQESASVSESIPEPGTCISLKAGNAAVSGQWSANTTILNAIFYLGMSKTDRFGNDISAVLSAINPGDEVSIIMETNPAVRAKFTFDSLFLDNPTNVYWNVTAVSGVPYPTNGENFYFCFVYNG